MKFKRGQITIYISFIIMAILIITIASVLAPMGVLFNSKMYEAGEEIMLRANSTIADINDSTVRTRIYDAIDSGLAASENNIQVNADLFKYSWILIIGLTGLVVFLFTRRLVEYGGGGFV